MEIFAWGEFMVFHDIAFVKNFPPRENKTDMTLWRKQEKYLEYYPHVKGLTNIFPKLSPSEK